MNKLKAWFIAARLFVLPLLFAFSFFGNALAGFNVSMWAVAVIVTGSVWICAHFVNDWRDYALGVDKLNGGSTAKSYTGASQIIPLGLLSVRAVQLSAIGLLLLSAFSFALFVPLRLDTVIIYCLGVTMALTYTDYFKPRGIGEICFFIMLFSVLALSYSIVEQFNLTALAVGTLAGMIGVMLPSMDHFPDIQGPLDKVTNLAELLFKTKMRLSGMYWFLVTALFTMQMGFTILNWLPQLSLFTLFTLPLAHISGVFLDYNIRKGVPLVLLWSICYMLLGGVGALC